MIEKHIALSRNLVLSVTWTMYFYPPKKQSYLSLIRCLCFSDCLSWLSILLWCALRIRRYRRWRTSHAWRMFPSLLSTWVAASMRFFVSPRMPMGMSRSNPNSRCNCCPVSGIIILKRDLLRVRNLIVPLLTCCIAIRYFSRQSFALILGKDSCLFTQFIVSIKQHVLSAYFTFRKYTHSPYFTIATCHWITFLCQHVEIITTFILSFSTIYTIANQRGLAFYFLLPGRL